MDRGADQSIQTQAKEATALIVAPSWLAVIDKNGNLYYLRQAKAAAIQKFDAPAPNPKANAGCAHHLSLYLDAKKRSYLLIYDETKKGYTSPVAVPIPNGVPTISCFSPDGLLLAIGDEEGRVWLIHTQSAQPIALLPKCADAISFITFSQEGSTLAYGSFMCDAHLYCLNSHTLLHSHRTGRDHPVILAQFFHTKPWLLMATRHNEVVLYDREAKRSHPITPRLADWPLCAYLEGLDRFALIGDKGGKLWLLNLEDRPPQMTKVASYDHPVVAIAFWQARYIIALGDGSVVMLDTQEPLAKMIERIEAQDAQGAIALAKESPWLRHHEAYRRLDALFDQQAALATQAFSQRDTTGAKGWLAPFKEEIRYAGRIGALEIFSTKIAAFGDAIRAERYDQAYAMVQSNDFYKRLADYQRLEKLLEAKFRAAILMLRGKRPDPISARKALDEFSRVPAKSKVLTQLFEQPKLFQAGDDLLKNNHYQDFYNLLQRYPILGEAPFYRKYEEASQRAYSHFQTLIKEHEYLEALRHADSIQSDFPKLYERIKETIEALKVEMAFEESLRDRNFQSALSYAMRHTLLLGHREYTGPFAHYNQRFDKALSCAFEFDFEGMHTLLQPLSKIRYFKERTLLAYQAYYLEEIRRIGSTLKAEEWALALKRFVERFGNPPLLGLKIAPFKVQPILQEQLEWQDASGFWRKPILTSLLSD